ncbi:MAG: GGDEF domain-containing protein [Candidatus Dormibacteria bacterium]
MGRAWILKGLGGRLGRMPPPELGLLSRNGAFLYGAGGTLVLVSLAMDRGPGTNIAALLAIVAAAYAVTAILIVGRDSLPVAIFPYLTAVGSLLISGLVYFDGAHASAYSLLYVWAAIYACYFYSHRWAAFEVLWIGLLSGVELYLKERGNLPLSRWLLVFGTTLVAGIAVRQLVIRLHDSADLDGLTKLPNRRRLEAELHQRTADRDHGLWVLFIDLDFLGRYVEEMGDRLGDRHVAESARAWRSILRPGDSLSRLRGKTFVALVSGLDREAARAVSERLRVATPNGQTASLGIAHWNGKESVAELLERGDAALYEAKVQGRDRIVEAPSAPGFAAAEDQPQVWAKMVPRILETRSMRVAFQPIYRLGGMEIDGYEALARPPGRRP